MISSVTVNSQQYPPLIVSSTLSEPQLNTNSSSSSLLGRHMSPEGFYAHYSITNFSSRSELCSVPIMDIHFEHREHRISVSLRSGLSESRSTTLVLVSFWNCWTNFDEYSQLLSRWKYGSTTSTFLHIIIIICAAPPTNTFKAFWLAVALAAWGAGEPAGRNAGRVCVDAVRYDGNVCVKYICRNVFVFLNPVGASVCFLWCWNSSVSYYSFIYIIFYAFICFWFFFLPVAALSFCSWLWRECRRTCLLLTYWYCWSHIPSSSHHSSTRPPTSTTTTSTHNPFTKTTTTHRHYFCANFLKQHVYGLWN